MDNKIISITKATSMLKADSVLDNAKGNLQSVLVLGYNHDGDIEIGSSSDMNNAYILFLLECFKRGLLNGAYQ